MRRKFGLAVELAFLKRQVNGYFVVYVPRNIHSPATFKKENGVLCDNDMSMEQGWEMHFSDIWEPQSPNPKSESESESEKPKSESPWLF